MSPLLAESMSHAAFSMNQDARRNATGIRRLPRLLSMRPSTFSQVGFRTTAPTGDNATTVAGFARASTALSGLMNPMDSGKPGAGSNTGGTIAKTPAVPANAAVSASVSDRSATAMSQPNCAQGALLLRSLTTPRTG